ncbi:hypothetical protein [Nostocoides sp. HKS02]|uniref:hypothetical protein n=1 Tax=Nostocoides sp. HKS02 TaxID=1813880 RepID=UPI001E5E407F|nr:hypothetical protein [Tetrasphaera sp. HKS02]
MVKLSLDSVTGFSTAPLRAATWLGLLGGVAAILLLAYALVSMARGDTLPGWTSTVVAVAGVGAVQLLCVGILGEYVGRMYAQLQARPTYYVAYDSLTGPVTSVDGPLRAESRPAAPSPADTAPASRPPAARR